MSLFDLHGRKAVVTGAASGIGQATAQLLREHGATVLAIDNRPIGDAGQALTVDLSSQKAIDAALGQIGGGIDILCNIAGVSGVAPAPLVMQVNFLGLRHLTESLLPVMSASGSIVNLASVAGQGWKRRWAELKQLSATAGFAEGQAWLDSNSNWPDDAYRYSKEAVIAWTALRGVGTKRDLGIRMNSVSPGPVQTRLLADFKATLGPGRIDDSIARGGRAGTPDDIARSVLFLASDASAWLCAENLIVDGGVTMSRSVEQDVMN